MVLEPKEVTYGNEKHTYELNAFIWQAYASIHYSAIQRSQGDGRNKPRPCFQGSFCSWKTETLIGPYGHGLVAFCHFLQRSENVHGNEFEWVVNLDQFQKSLLYLFVWLHAHSQELVTIVSTLLVCEPSVPCVSWNHTCCFMTVLDLSLVLIWV